MKRWIVLGLVVILAIVILRRRGSSSAEHQLQTSEINYGDLEITISATGTVEPEEVIDVGAQVGGKINSFGKNKDGVPIDYGTQVDEGTVLAQIDQSLYAADVTQAKAAVDRAGADVAQQRARLQQAENDWKRAQALGPSDALAASDYDSFKAAYEIAKANVTVAEATLQQERGSLERAEQNLGYTTIRSPVKGVIIDRRVNIGQTVVASLNAPSLFLIAKDLHRMQVWVAVNEADIGSIHPGQKATFTVDALPGKTFSGTVRKVRLNATMTQNVVTYTVEVETDNSNGDLLPYLTANLKFEISRQEHVLLVPNAALRWTPPADLVATTGNDEEEQSDQEPAARRGGEKHGRPEVLWTPDGGLVKPLEVRIVGTDGIVSAVEGSDVHEGLPVVIREEAPGSGSAVSGQQGSNPFAPPIMRRGRRH
jgi:HlyD family secretion protein